MKAACFLIIQKENIKKKINHNIFVSEANSPNQSWFRISVKSASYKECNISSTKRRSTKVNLYTYVTITGVSCMFTQNFTVTNLPECVIRTY